MHLSTRCALALVCTLAMWGCEPEPQNRRREAGEVPDSEGDANDAGRLVDATRPESDGSITQERDAAHDDAKPVEDTVDAAAPDDALAGDRDEPATSEDASAHDGARADRSDGGVLRNSFERAERLSPDGTSQLVDERSADQVDYFVFRAEAGTYYEITTDNARFTPDNVIALYDDTRELVAENDDGSVWPGDAHDARLVVRAKRSGDHYIRIEDPYTAAEFFDGDFALLYFHVRVRALEEGSDGFARVGAAQTLPSFATDPESGYRYLTVVGEFGEAAAQLEFEGIAGHALIARVHRGGIHGDGSSVVDGRVTVRSQQGRALAAIERMGGVEHIRPPVDAGTLRMTLEPSGALGDNGFYAVDLVLLPDNPSEQRERENDRARGAEAVMLSNVSVGRGLLLSRLAANDVDYYRVQAEVDQRIYVSCEGEASGSGVRGLVAELRDGTDTLLGNASEVDDGLTLEWIVTKADTYYVRLSSRTGPESEIDPWVRCVVFVN
jgi:hypothetical protein